MSPHRTHAARNPSPLLYDDIGQLKKTQTIAKKTHFIWWMCRAVLFFSNLWKSHCVGQVGINGSRSEMTNRSSATKGHRVQSTMRVRHQVDHLYFFKDIFQACQSLTCVYSSCSSRRDEFIASQSCAPFDIPFNHWDGGNVVRFLCRLRQGNISVVENDTHHKCNGEESKNLSFSDSGEAH